MNRNPSCLELHVHSADGQIARFAQSDAAAALALLDHIHPSRIFGQNHLMISGQETLTLSVFPTAAIVRLDLIMEEFPDWPFQFGISDVHDVTEEEFRSRYQFEEAKRLPLLPAGSPIVVYAEIELASGERVFLEVHTHVEKRLPVEQSMFIQQILSAPSLYARRRGGGAVLLNPSAIVRLTLYPGPAQLPNALVAELRSD